MSGVGDEKQRGECSPISYFTSSEIKQSSECGQGKKQRNERSQRFHFNTSEVKQRSESSQIFHFNSSDVKQCREHSQRFPFNSSEVKHRSECTQ